MLCPMGSKSHPEFKGMTLEQVAQTEDGRKVLGFLAGDQYQPNGDQNGRKAKTAAKVAAGEAMSGVKSNRQIWGKDFPIGGEWDAGATPPLLPTCPSGRWTVRRGTENFIVIFHRFDGWAGNPSGNLPTYRAG